MANISDWIQKLSQRMFVKGRLFGRPYQDRSRRHTRLRIELLERRVVLSGTPTATIVGNTTLLASRVLHIDGTTNNDNMLIWFFNGTQFETQVNGATSVFNNADYDLVEFDGLAGTDTVTVHASPTPATVTMTPTSVAVDTSTVDLALTNVETGYVFGGATDTVHFTDSSGDDTFYGLPQYSALAGTGYFMEAVGAGTVDATSTTSNDVAIFYDSSGNDSLQTNIFSVTQTGAGYSLMSLAFPKVYANALYGGIDTAQLTGAPLGPDTAYLLPGYSIMVSGNAFREAIGYDQVTANAGPHAGSDVALAYDSAGNDTATLSSSQVSLVGTGFNNTAAGFDSAYAFSSAGTDTANFTDTSGDDNFYGFADYAVMYLPSNPNMPGTGFLVQAQNFTSVHEIASTGTDVSLLYDGPGNDTLMASGNQATMTYANGHTIKVEAIDAVYAFGVNGGSNTRNVTNPLAYSLVFEGMWV